MSDLNRVRNVLLAILTTVIVAAALRASYPVTMPLAVAFVIVAAVWPVKPWLDKILPSSLSYIGTILVLIVIVALFIIAVYYSTAEIVQAFSQNERQLTDVFDRLRAWLERLGVSGLGGDSGSAELIAIGKAVLANAYTVLAYLGLIGIFVIFGLPEIPSFRIKIREILDAADRRTTLAATDEIGEKIRAYLGVTTVMSLLTGLAVGLWAFVLGIDLALVWGIVNFLLNYVPVIGNLIGIIPPSLYALLQFQNGTMAIIAFVGFAVIQIVISNFIYPLFQGRSLSLSPLVIVVALTFWGWVWGVAGALIAVPLTTIIVIVCEQFGSTRWIARLLSGSK